MARARRGRARGARAGYGAGRLTERPAPAPRALLALDLAPEVALELDGEVRTSDGLVLGRLAGAPVAALDPAAAPASALRTAHRLGASILLLGRHVRATESGSASGASVGRIRDHIGLLTPNPLVGPNADDVGPRFPDLSAAYDEALGVLAEDAARALGFELAVGVYAGHPEPNLATPAEYRMLHRAGADWIGRGGVPEVILARHGGMRVLGLVALPGGEGRLAELVRSVVARLPERAGPG